MVEVHQRISFGHPPLQIYHRGCHIFRCLGAGEGVEDKTEHCLSFIRMCGKHYIGEWLN